MTTATQLLRTPFHSFHLQHKAKMVDFAGWEMPLSYGSIIEEHRHCRASAGFFDVSHMGRLRFTGRHARRFLDMVCTRQVLGMEPGQCRYGIVCNERGGCLDDIIVYCRIGERSSHTWFVLTQLLGFKHVRNYDGSWTDWGNRAETPLEVIA
jgi:glycine cleavage system aminomethyltransferase T